MTTKRSLPHCSKHAFTEFVKLAQDQGVEELPRNRMHLDMMRDDTLSDTPYGPLIVGVSLFAKPPLAPKTVVAINPLAYIYTAFRNGGGFFHFLRSKLMAVPSSPASPWRLCLYSDEVVPGNQLAVFHSRKVWCVNFSFLEFHPHLSNENAWCPLLAETTDSLKNISCGISQVFAQLIKLFFGDDFDLRAGIQLVGPDGTQCIVRLYAVLSMFLQDGAAHKMVWGCRGDAGTKLCMLCTNLVAVKSELVDEDRSKLLVCNLIHEHQLSFATDASIRAAIKRLDAFKLTETAGAFKMRQQAIGFTWQEHGLLNDPTLEDIVFPASQFLHDWMHCVFAGGVFNIVILLCFTAVKEKATNVWDIAQAFVQNWQWPKSVKFNPCNADYFSKSRVKSNEKALQFKCTASHGLSLLPVLCLFIRGLRTRVATLNTIVCDAVDALHDLVEALVAVPLGLITADDLRSRVAHFLQVVEAAGWQLRLVPKFHWLIHLAAALARWGVIPTCWVHERKHRMVKRYGEDVRNTAAYSRSLLSETISQQLVDVEAMDAFPSELGLIRPQVAPRKERSFLLGALDFEDDDVWSVHTSASVRLTSMSTVSRGDVVLFKASDHADRFQAAQVWLLACIHGEHVALASVWEFHSSTDELTVYWQSLERPYLIPMDQLMCAVMWMQSTPELARTFIPFQFRGFKPI